MAEKLAFATERIYFSHGLQHFERDAVGQAFSVAKRGTSIVFGPGFASFDMFTSYLERGKPIQPSLFRFEETVRSLYSRRINLNESIEK